MVTESAIAAAGAELDRRIDDVLTSERPRLNRALARIRRPAAALGMAETPLGRMMIAVSERGVVLSHFVDDDAGVAAMLEKLRLAFDAIEDRSPVALVAAEIRRHLDGEEDALHQSVDLSLASNPFERKALMRLLKVPRGALISYQALGAAAGAPRGARAVGNAMHNNPVPIYVPCHRVICSDGSLGGYGGGRWRKLRLLRAEGFAIDDAAARVPAGAVWGHRVTRIYCRETCPAGARANRARLLWFADSAQARRQGLRACKICRPQ